MARAPHDNSDKNSGSTIHLVPGLDTLRRLVLNEPHVKKKVKSKYCVAGKHSLCHGRFKVKHTRQELSICECNCHMAVETDPNL